MNLFRSTVRIWSLLILASVLAGVLAAAGAFRWHAFAIPAAGLAVAVATGLALAAWRAGVLSRALARMIVESETRPLHLPEPRRGQPLGALIVALMRREARIGALIGESSTRANQVLLVSQGITHDTDQVTEHAEHQTGETISLAAAMEEMGATANEIARNAAHTAESATRITQANATSTASMERVVAAVDEVKAVFDRATQTIGDLGKASEGIARINGVINGIAEQTNLLSLNAAIEAARAGESGRGFSVVADEVRKLAENTKESTREIAATIARNRELTEEAIQAMTSGRATVEESVRRTEATRAALQTVAAGANDVSDQTHQIASAAEEQTATVGEITRNIERIAQLSGETQGRMARSRAAAAEMTAVARDLERHLDGGHLARLGLAPTEDAIALNRAFGPLCRFLSGVLGRAMFVRIGESYDQSIEDLGTGRAIVSYQTPSTYVEAHARYGVMPLVVPLTGGKPYYRSAVVVRADSGIQSMGELRGKRFAFGDAKSTGSKAMPESMLKEAGIGLGDLAGHGFVGSHDAVAKAVLAKDYDAGGLMLSVAEKYTGQGLQVLASSTDIPQFPLCAAPDLPAADRERLIKALVGLTDRTVLGAMGAQITGFARITDADYDGVRRMLERLRH